MYVLDEAVRLITESPGNIVYFLVTLFALQQAFVSALTARRAAPDAPLARRWLWSAGGALVARVALLVVSLLGLAGLLAPATVVPPLERWILVATTLLMIWAGLYGSRPQRWQTVALLSLLALTLILCGADVAIGALSSGPLDLYVVEQGIVLVVLLLALVLAAILRPPEWEWVAGIAIFWILGTVAQLAWRDPANLIDGWQRLASLIALPMLSVLVHRQVLSVAAPARPESWLSDALWLTTLVQSISTARDLDSTLILASSRLARLLRVERCVIALTPGEGTDPAGGLAKAEGAETAPAEAGGAGALQEGILRLPDKVRVVAIHPPTAAQIDPPDLKVADYAALEAALGGQQAVVVDASPANPWLDSLYAALGFETSQPLAVIPLYHHARSLGLLLLGRPLNASRWDEAALEGPVRASEVIAGAIAAARSRGAEPSDRIGQQEAQRLSPAKATDAEHQKLVEAYAAAKQQIQALNGRIRNLVAELKARDEEILALNAELDARRRSISETELSLWQNEVRQLAGEREVLQRRIEELEQERDGLLEERAHLNQRLAEVKETVARVESHRERLEEEVAALQAAARGGAEPPLEPTEQESSDPPAGEISA